VSIAFYGLDNTADSMMQVNDLQASGIEVVLSTTLYAIVGAVALQRGEPAAKEIARESILRPLGIL
jgi:large subunit ribosomal protein L15